MNAKKSVTIHNRTCNTMKNYNSKIAKKWTNEEKNSWLNLQSATCINHFVVVVVLLLLKCDRGIVQFEDYFQHAIGHFAKLYTDIRTSGPILNVPTITVLVKWPDANYSIHFFLCEISIDCYVVWLVFVYCIL